MLYNLFLSAVQTVLHMRWAFAKIASFSIVPIISNNYTEINVKLQQEIAAEKLKSQVGKELEVLIETKTFDSKYYAGRSYMDVPDIDGLIYIKNENKEDLENQFIKCKITDVKGYDLIAQI